MGLIKYLGMRKGVGKALTFWVDSVSKCQNIEQGSGKWSKLRYCTWRRTRVGSKMSGIAEERR